jgi:ABC-type siderophore export system fused ATPase/permease subunit
MNVFDAELKAAHNERLAEVTKQPGQKHREFELLEFKNIGYTYFDQQKKQTFSLGPIDWQIKKGEVVFLTGGNGSGKSTFVNLLTGLYCPKEGQVLVNGKETSYPDYLNFKESISAIFTTNYLFSENYDDYELSCSNAELGKYIELVRMQNILRLNNGKSTFEDKLSKGQQKRLAMIYALMEERPILVLDEWAAEQDPAFRAYFYTCLLPDLKRMGKTIIAVTHDDNYFLSADRIIKFDCGRIVSDLKGGVLSPLTASRAV